jgi:hypothetical protein
MSSLLLSALSPFLSTPCLRRVAIALFGLTCASPLTLQAQIVPDGRLNVPHQMIQIGSAQADANRFIITGRGGLPPSPQEMLSITSGWVDNREAGGPNSELRRANCTSPTDYQEATTWSIDAAGVVTLLAEYPPTAPSFLEMACQRVPAFTTLMLPSLSH